MEITTMTLSAVAPRAFGLVRGGASSTSGCAAAWPLPASGDGTGLSFVGVAAGMAILESVRSGNDAHLGFRTARPPV